MQGVIPDLGENLLVLVYISLPHSLTFDFALVVDFTLIDDAGSFRFGKVRLKNLSVIRIVIVFF